MRWRRGSISRASTGSTPIATRGGDADRHRVAAGAGRRRRSGNDAAAAERSGAAPPGGGDQRPLRARRPGADDLPSLLRESRAEAGTPEMRDLWHNGWSLLADHRPAGGRVGGAAASGAGVTQIASHENHQGHEGTDASVRCFVCFGRSCSRHRPSSRAETRWAVIISGASGGEKYAEQMATWRDRPAIGAGRSLRVQGRAREAARRRSREDRRPARPRPNVRSLFAEIKKAGSKDDFVLVVLLGHGTYDGDVAKFNLVGPDLTAKDWTDAADRRAGPRHARQHHRGELSVPRIADAPRAAS